MKFLSKPFFISILFLMPIVSNANSCLNTFSEGGKPALHHAVISGNMKTVKTLVNNGFNINAKDRYGKTALIVAIINSRQEAVRFLIKNGADVNVTDKSGRTALLFAAIDGHIKFVKLLIKNGADIHAKDSLGATVLHGAVASRINKGVVNFLIAKGSDIHAIDKEGRSVLDWAIRGNQIDESSKHIDLLTEKGAKSNNRNATWVEFGDFAQTL